jgi:hypothetical protein
LQEAEQAQAGSGSPATKDSDISTSKQSWILFRSKTEKARPSGRALIWLRRPDLN